MFELLMVAVVLIAVLGWACALDGGRDVFHPLVFVLPMLVFLYAWMPFRIWSFAGLDQFFDASQLVFVQTVNTLGVLAFVAGCLSAGVRIRRVVPIGPKQLGDEGCRRLMLSAAIAGSLGLLCWTTTILNVGGFVNAYSKSYSGGWDDSGYVRDGTLLLLVGVLLAITALASGGSRRINAALIGIFGFPWLSQALLMARRGPTFAFAVVVLMGWYTTKRRRPPVVAVGIVGLGLAWLVLFLVTNRGSIYLGSDFNVQTNVSGIVDKADTGNEYIYGSGTILAAVRRDHYFWMRRYLAQVLVRPIPSAIWPTKYEDFGTPELLNNAGTGEGFADALGWVGAVGAAPGIVADLWVELWWLAIPAMGAIGYFYGLVWKRAVLLGGVWATQYVLLSALSIYLVMQTMEAVIFRVLLLSIPCWLAWRWATKSTTGATYQLSKRSIGLTPGGGYEHV